MTMYAQTYSSAMTDEELINHLDPADPLQARVAQILLDVPSEVELEEDWLDPGDVETMNRNVDDLSSAVDDLESLADYADTDNMSDETQAKLYKLVKRMNRALGNIPQ